jgi:hypothetical protein
MGLRSLLGITGRPRELVEQVPSGLATLYRSVGRRHAYCEPHPGGVCGPGASVEICFKSRRVAAVRAHRPARHLLAVDRHQRRCRLSQSAWADVMAHISRGYMEEVVCDNVKHAHRNRHTHVRTRCCWLSPPRRRPRVIYAPRFSGHRRWPVRPCTELRQALSSAEGL